MNMVYRSIGTSKQNIHKRLDHELEVNEEKEQLLLLMRQLRGDHPGLGARKMFLLLSPQTMGRDGFFQFYAESGFRLKSPRNYRRTTDSSGVIRFPNLIAGLELTGVNQVWVSDITYYDLSGKFCYLTFIIDLYSRKITGYSASQSLRTVDTTIPALEMALPAINHGQCPILHSDGGGQYYCKEFLALTEGKVLNSMCETVYENAHAERLNGTIKNEYLASYRPDSFQQLRKALDKAVRMYNQKRPHQSLKGLSPAQFEQTLNPINKQLIIKENLNSKFVKPVQKTVNLI